MLTLTQRQTLKPYIQTNFPTSTDQQIADALNTQASPDYWVWRSNVSRSEVYNTLSPTGSSWDWTTYKNQGVSEQNAWVQMFMGDQANLSQLNVRSGISKIFTGSAPATAQRDHCLAVGRRLAKLAEKLLAIAVLSPPANTGNNVAQPRGDALNPDVLGFEGNISVQDVVDSLNTPDPV